MDFAESPIIQNMLAFPRILFWRFVGLVALLLGLVGLFLPIMPTVPFVLVAAWAASKGWPELERYLLTHKHFGPPIRNWRERGAISRSTKSITTLMFCGSLSMVWLLPFGRELQTALSVFMVIAVIWLWSRPDA